MSKYDYSAYRIDETTTREYTFDGLVGEPSLIVTVANDVNVNFKKYRIRKSIEIADSVQSTINKTASIEARVEEMLRRLDDDVEWDRDIIAKACVVGWGTPPVAIDGSSPEFSPEECLDFLNAIPPHMFKNFANFVSNIYNFQNGPDPKAAAEKLGNSSPKD